MFTFARLSMVIASALMLFVAVDAWAYPNTEVDDDFVAPLPPQYSTIEAAVANTDPGGTVTVHPGNYAPTGIITIPVPMTINGPQANVDPRSAAALRAAGGPAEAVVNIGANNTLFTIAADNVTINGFDIVSSANTSAAAPAVTTDNSSTRQSPRVAYNFLRRTGGLARHAVVFNNAAHGVMEYNNVSGFYGHDIGALGLQNTTNTMVRFNQVDNLSGDPSNGIAVGVSCTATTITRNIVGTSAGTAAKYAIAMGYSAASPRPSDATCSYNIVGQFWQAGISIQMPNCLVIGNDVTHTDTLNANRAAIYVRDSLCQNVTVAYNYIHDTTLQNSSRNAALRYFDWVTGQDATILGKNNFFYKNRACYNGDVAMSKTDKSATGTFDIRNNWWGHSEGPSTPLGPIFPAIGSCSITAGQLTDFCSPTYKTIDFGLGHALGMHGTAVNYCWYPWALFRGRVTPVAATGGTRTFGINFPDNNRYTLHQVTLPDLTGDTMLIMASPTLRETVPAVRDSNNAMQVILSDGVDIASGLATIRIQYIDTDKSLGGDVDDGQSESDMKFAVYNTDTNQWEYCAALTTVDTVNNYVQGSVCTLTPYNTFGAVINAVESCGCSVFNWDRY